jgi:hypothetical protein
VDPKYEKDDGLSLDDTVKVMRRRISDPMPGELQFRQDVAAGFEKVDSKLGKIDVRLARIEERQLSRSTVAEIARTEMAVLANKVDTLSKIVYALGGMVATGCIGLFFERVVK